jgi:hypothetical protein
MPTRCPFCNAPVPVPNPRPTDGRVPCPRCEELVTVGDADLRAAPTIVVPPPANTPSLTNRTIAGIVVAVMLGMAGLGLAFALQTVGVRRANDTKGARPPEPAFEAAALAPAAWPGLGHLPDDVQVVAGIRVADALDSPAGRALLGALGLADAKKTPILGVAPSHVDYLMFGASLRTLPPRVTTVVHGSIGDAPVPGRTTDQHGKTLHRVKLWASGPEGAIWRADRHTLIAALLPEDFDKVPAKPQAAAPLPELMERLDPATQAWLAATVDANNPAFGFATPFLPQADRDAWTKLDALVVCLRADGPKLTLTVQVRGKNVSAGEAIAMAVAASLTTAGLTAERKSDGDWQKLTTTADADKLTGWLRPR